MWHKLGIQVELEDMVNLFISKQNLNIPNVYTAGFKDPLLTMILHGTKVDFCII